MESPMLLLILMTVFQRRKLVSCIVSSFEFLFSELPGQMSFFLLFCISLLRGISSKYAASSVSCSGEISTESYAALEALYNSTAGLNWAWDPPPPSPTVWHFQSPFSAPCSESWQGLICSVNLSKSSCDIVSLELPYYKLSGTMPSELGNLVNLEALFLNANSLEGSVPSELGNLVKLKSLYLCVNSLEGSIPSELSNLVNLEALGLFGNSLEGSIPAELGNLVNLKTLSVYDNSLDGSIPSELGNLANLERMSVYDNLLVGSIPSELGNLVNLEALYLSENFLEGFVPSELGNLLNLEALYLYDNSLEGSIPSELSNLVNLEALSLSDNSLESSVPSELGNLVKLKSLYLSVNSLEGSAPSELGNLGNLDALYINDNSLEGTIPSELGNLVNLEALGLYCNSLEGSIPSELGNLVNLEALALYNNSLEGSIPFELGNLVNLEALYLNDNSLEGSIPSQLGNVVNLEALYLSENFLEGSIPSELRNLVNLQALSLNDNSLIGALPLGMCGWPGIQSINLSANVFSGDISILSFENFTSLQVLDISLNRISGTLPESVFCLPELRSVVFSQNCFSGSLPSSMCSNKKLRSIVLDLLTGSCGSRSGEVFQGIVLAHYMTGTIPSCLWSSSSIQTLHLVGNGLHGSLTDLSNASVLSVLALGSNQLTGTIPISFQRHNFTQLDVSINRLSGTLTSDLVVSPNAAVYDLSTNRLSGHIPVALYSAYASGAINVLEGNVFSCQQNNIPESDVSHSSYQCGSVNFQYSLVAWAAGFILCSVTVVAVMAAVGSDWAVRSASIVRSRENISVIVGPVCCLAVCLVGLVGYVSMKVSSGDAYTLTYARQYWWTSTVAFMHDWIISSFLFVALVGISAVFTTSMAFLTKNIDSAEEITDTSISVVYRVSAHLVNAAVVTVVNGVYVLAAIGNVNSSSLLAIQASLGLFKLSWSSWVVPWLLARLGMTDAHKISHWLFMVLFVFLGAPFASSFCESSSCFLYVLTRPAPISFSLISPVIDFITDCGVTGCLLFSVPEGQLVPSSIPAPWIYSYQCSSAVITGYAPVLMLSYLASGIVIPFSILMIAFFPSPWYGVVKKTMVIFEYAYFDNGTAPALLEKKFVSALGRKYVVKYILNFAVMMTFGLAVPLLAVAILCDTAFNTAVLLLLLERFTGSCGQNGLDASRLRQEFWNSFRMNNNEVAGCVYIVLGYVSTFWSLFAFDWIADVYGSLAGGLTMLVPLLLPTMTGFWLLRWHRAVRKAGIIWRQETNSIELCETGNPVIFPQATNDDFRVSEK
jgi:Leucine-rich repeat (LRR) protein